MRPEKDQAVPLYQIAGLFKGVVFSTPEVVVDRPGWLHVQRCEAWTEACPHKRATMLSVYRSPLVKDTSPIYAPVAEEILGAGRADVTYRRSFDDPTMMWGIGECFVIRLAAIDHETSAPIGEVRARTQQGIDAEEGEPAT